MALFYFSLFAFVQNSFIALFTTLSKNKINQDKTSKD